MHYSRGADEGINITIDVFGGILER